MLRTQHSTQAKTMHRRSQHCLPWHLQFLIFTLVMSVLKPSCTAFSLRSRVQLKSAIDVCLKLSPKGKCIKAPLGPIGTWDVSHVTDMSRMFAGAKYFDSEISKWDVSRVKDMSSMFLGARSFNGDLSKWDVSSVKDMHGMFFGATVFKRQLCGAAWVHSKAIKDSMFEGSSGSISSTACTATTAPPVFSPQSRSELKGAVNEFVEISEKDGQDVDESEATSPAAKGDGGSSAQMSFIHAAREGGVEALLGAFGHVGKFDSSLKALKVVDVSEGFVRASLPVTREVCNFYDTLHGGATSTLVDVLGTMAILSKDPLRPGVSVDLNVNFLSPAKLGETVMLEGQLLKMGRSLAFTQVNLLHEDGSLIATGRHTKAFPFVKKK